MSWRLWRTTSRRMNNLLRTLTESNVKPTTDLRLLLTTIKEGRKQSVDTKLSDPFYDALEGLLLDLKTVALDNRDAEAFLKPVSKAEVPDYYDVISNPMDFQTMLKKVKQKQYRSKREFKDDLDLIWSNCYTYNASENHPLRQCVKRLKAKADRLLKHITDRRERTDPIIPNELGANHTGIYPKINGSGRTHTRSPSYSSKVTTPGVATFKTTSSQSQSRYRSDLPFPDSIAITRTPEGMGMFYEIDKEVNMALKKSNPRLIQRLKKLAPSSMDVDEKEEKKEEEERVEVNVNGEVGDKRKLQSSPNAHRPRKRARFLAPYPIPMSSDKDEISELWWAAAQSDTLLANSIPPIPFGPSSSNQKRPSSRDGKPRSKLKNSHICYSNKKSDEVMPAQGSHTNTLLHMMNNNIKTIRRVRHTHSKFSALNATTMTNDEEEGGLGTGVAGPSGSYNNGASSSGLGMNMATELNAAVDDDILNEKVDENPWLMTRKVPVRGKGKGKEKEYVVREGGIEVGDNNAWGCLEWANQKILEHSGFQGASQVALDVMTGVMSEYLSNVGRTIKYLCDNYSANMTPEEIILHTLFESGSSKIQDLERYISDDVERYGTRLNELEKKIVGAYRENTAGEVLEDEGLFEEEDEEEAGALAIGDFADALGEDYLGLRELGIAAEFGMSSLSIPKKLLKGRKSQHGKPATTKPNEPPPPFPPPPLFIPLLSTKVEDQIGLLKPYYTNRFMTLPTATPPPHRSILVPPLGLGTLPGPNIGAVPLLTGPSIPGLATQAPTLTSGIGLPSSNAIIVPGASTSVSASTSALIGQSQPIDLTSLPELSLPDDVPNPVQVKMGPLGQIVKGGGTSSGAKKKAKAASALAGSIGANVTINGGGGSVGGFSGSGNVGEGINGSGSNAGNGGITPVGVGSNISVEGTPKKKKGSMGIGTGNGRKKKGPEGSGSGGNTSGGGGGGGGQGSPYPPVVVASA